MSEIKKNNEPELSYSDSDIQLLSQVAHIRQRFGMYAGGDPSTHIGNEVIDNSIDEAMNGFASEITVILNTKENRLTVIDDGRGIPNGIHKCGLNTLEVVISKENSGGKFDGSKSFKASGGLNGTGLKVTNALSEDLEAISERDGRRVKIKFKKGKRVGEVENLPLTGKTGTTISFTPDKKLLLKNNLYIIKPDKIKESCQMRAFLNKGITINVQIDDDKFTFKYDKGVEEFLNLKVKKPLYGMKPISIEKDFEDNKYELSFVFDSENTDEKIFLYTNSIRNTSGTNETGFKTGLTRAFNKFIKKHDLIPKRNQKSLSSISGDDIRKGIVCCINGKISDPLYSAQIKNEISNPETVQEISSMLTNYLETYMEENFELFKKICTRIIQFAIATNNLKNNQKKIVSASAAASGFAFSDKYIECSETDPEKIELLICEGKSAAGSLRPGRIGLFQAIYSLKGKPLNTYGSTNSALISNAEFNELMLIIFGTNNIKEIDYEKIRVKRVIFAADSDEDGLHIVCLLAMAFKEHFIRMILDGRVFVACPPKYRITVNNNYVYFKNDREFTTYKSQYVEKKYSILNEGITLYDIVDYEDDYKREFNNLKNKYSLPKDIISMILSNDSLLPVAEYLDEQGLEVSETENEGEYYVQGLLDYDWIDCFLTIDMKNDIQKSLLSIFEYRSFVITDKDINETYECDIIDGIELIDKAFKFTRYRYKGLTE